MTSRRGGQDTRERILDAALALFRKQGFDATTMRNVAAACKLSLGAAYYYFPSKEAIVLAYYERSEAAHAEPARAALAATTGLRERLAVLIHGKLELVRRDRKLLSALIRGVADPDDPLSVFAPTTRAVREHAMALFRDALEGTPVPDALKDVLPRALWMLHLGVLLYFLHDRSPRQARTAALVDGLLDLVVPIIHAAALPMLAPLHAQLVGVLGNAGLIPRK